MVAMPSFTPPSQWGMKHYVQAGMCLLWFVLWCMMLGGHTAEDKAFKASGPLLLLNINHSSRNGLELPTITVCPNTDPDTGAPTPLGSALHCVYKDDEVEIPAVGRPTTITFEGVWQDDERNTGCLQFLQSEHTERSEAGWMHSGFGCQLDATYPADAMLFVGFSDEDGFHPVGSDEKWAVGEMPAVSPGRGTSISLVKHDVKHQLNKKPSFTWYEQTMVPGAPYKADSPSAGSTRFEIGYGMTGVLEYHAFTQDGWSKFARFGGGTIFITLIVMFLWAIAKYTFGWTNEDNSLFPPLVPRPTESAGPPSSYGSGTV